VLDIGRSSCILIKLFYRNLFSASILSVCTQAVQLELMRVDFADGVTIDVSEDTIRRSRVLEELSSADGDDVKRLPLTSSAFKAWAAGAEACTSALQGVAALQVCYPTVGTEH
jgi:hypothetical protein